MTSSPIADMFGTTDPAETAQRFETFKAELDKSARQRDARKTAGTSWVPPHLGEGTGWQTDPASSAVATLSKSLSPEVLASLQAELAKDISLTSPLTTGLIPYDLEEAAKVLAPVFTPLRNRIARVPGKGAVRRYKRITGITGSGTGGVATLSPFINDASTAAFGSVTLRRGPKISYQADDRTQIYKQYGLSDMVTWSAEFAGLGFTDARQLSQTSLMKATMLAEERAMLAGRDTATAGALGTPNGANVTLTTRLAGTAPAEIGNTAVIANLFVRISAEGMFGESIASAEVTTAGLAAVTGRVIDVTMSGAFIAGATGYRVFVGTATGLANQFFVGRTGCWGGVSGQGTASFTIQFTGAGTGGAPAAGTIGLAAESASSADAFDGILTVQLDPTQSGIVYSVGQRLSTTSIGAEFQNVFAGLYNGVAPGNGFSGQNTTVNVQGTKATPDVIWMAGQDRKQLSQAFLSGGSGNPTFFMSVDMPDSANMRMGQVVTGMLNETAGGELAVRVHPWLPQGTSLVLSETIEIQDSNIPAPFQMVMPQEMLAIDWPVIQHTYDASTYLFGALVQYAPSFSGAVTNILAA